MLFISLGFSLGPRGSMYDQGPIKVGVWEHILNCPSPSSPHCIKKWHNYRERALGYCTRHLTYTSGKMKACTSQECNAKETPPVILHFVADSMPWTAIFNSAVSLTIIMTNLRHCCSFQLPNDSFELCNLPELLMYKIRYKKQKKKFYSNYSWVRV